MCTCWCSLQTGPFALMLKREIRAMPLGQLLPGGSAGVSLLCLAPAAWVAEEQPTPGWNSCTKSSGPWVKSVLWGFEIGLLGNPSAVQPFLLGRGAFFFLCEHNRKIICLQRIRCQNAFHLCGILVVICFGLLLLRG